MRKLVKFSYFSFGAYVAHREKLFKLQNGYFLLYYHRQKVFHQKNVTFVLVVHDVFTLC
jgi:hypothetical protein